MIRPPRPGDEAALAALLSAMEAHYGQAVAEPVADAAAASLCRGAGPGGCLVAAGADAGLLGACFFAELFPGPALAPVLWLKDLFVAPAARSQGVGRALMQGLAREGVARGVARIEWATDAANLGARRFYERLGAGTPAKVALRLDAAGILRLASALDPGAETGD